MKSTTLPILIIIIGNIYRPPYNTRSHADTLLEEYKSTLSEFHYTYFCGDYNIDLLKVKRFQFNEEYFDSILTTSFLSTLLTFWLIFFFLVCQTMYVTGTS